MKKILLAFAILLCIAIVSPRALAQVGKDALTFNTSVSTQEYLLTPEATNFTETNKNDVSIKAVRKFAKAFKAVTDEKWYATPGGFFASFNQNGITTEVYYDEKGRWLCNFLTYHEEHLPTQLSKMMKSFYPGYNIFVVYEYQL
jgi:hypothetical protein